MKVKHWHSLAIMLKLARCLANFIIHILLFHSWSVWRDDPRILFVSEWSHPFKCVKWNYYDIWSINFIFPTDRRQKCKFRSFKRSLNVEAAFSQWKRKWNWTWTLQLESKEFHSLYIKRDTKKLSFAINNKFFLFIVDI